MNLLLKFQSCWRISIIYHESQQKALKHLKMYRYWIPQSSNCMKSLNRTHRIESKFPKFILNNILNILNNIMVLPKIYPYMLKLNNWAVGIALQHCSPGSKFTNFRSLIVELPELFRDSWLILNFTNLD